MIYELITLVTNLIVCAEVNVIVDELSVDDDTG